jgi:hypothetical protein
LLLVHRTNGTFVTLQDSDKYEEALDISTQERKFGDVDLNNNNNNNNNLQNQMIVIKREDTNVRTPVEEVYDVDLNTTLKKSKPEGNLHKEIFSSNIQKLNNQTILTTSNGHNKFTTPLTSFTSPPPLHYSQDTQSKTFANQSLNNEFHNAVKHILQDDKLLDSTELTIKKEGQSTLLLNPQTSKPQPQQPQQQVTNFVQQQQQQQQQLLEIGFQQSKLNPQIKSSEQFSSSLFNVSSRVNNRPTTSSSPLFFDLTQAEPHISSPSPFHQNLHSLNKVDPVLIVIPDSEGIFHSDYIISKSLRFVSIFSFR